MAPSRPGWKDCFRLCRALALVALGATMHYHLPAVSPSVDDARVAPLRGASAPVEAAERTIVVNRALVFAPTLPVSVPQPLRREFHRAPVTGLLAAVHRAPSPARLVASLPVERGSLRLPESVAAGFGRKSNLPRGSATAGLEDVPEGLPEPSYPVVDVVSRLAVTPVATPRRTSEEELVRQLIDRYAGALERLDVGAAQAAWPTVDGKALKRAFNQLASQRLTFQSCGITISGSTANARCRGSATYQPRIGSGPVHLASREWTFDFSKQDTDWRIVNTFVR